LTHKRERGKQAADMKAPATPSSADALERLLRDVRNCTLCAAHLPQKPRPVLQAGSRARILIAGQAPGRKVDRSGVPFDDPSGDRLRQWMGIGPGVFYDPDTVAILPMGFCYPGPGHSGDLPPRPECAAAWRIRLLQQMPLVQLTLVIGQYAQAWHLTPGSRETLTQTVRGWRAHGPGVIPLPHPSPRNNGWLRGNPWFEIEVLPALRERVAALTAASVTRPSSRS
jgi:uracil-DNA glycosylase